MIAVALVSGLLAAGCQGKSASEDGASGAPAASGPRSEGTFGGPAPRPTDVEQVLAGQTTDDLPVERALQLFVIAFGPLPGVRVPDGPRGQLVSGTLAVDAVTARWDELTAAQRHAVEQRLGTTVGPNPSSATPASGIGRSVRFRPAETDGPGADAYRPSVDASLRLLEARLGPMGDATPVQVQVMVTATPLRELGTARAWTTLVRRDLCRVTVHSTRIGEQRGPSLVLAHELFHCYQRIWRGGSGEAGPQPLWTREGLANWVAGAAVAGQGGADERILTSTYQRWQATPRTPLFARAYDAVGFFSLANQSAPGLWSRVRAITVDDASQAAYHDTVNGGDVVGHWGPLQYDLASWGSNWDLTGPEVPEISVSPPGAFGVLGNGAHDTIESAPYASHRAGVSIQAEITEIDVAGGTGGTARHGGSDEPIAQIAGQWCTGRECTCPPGTELEGQTFTRLPGADNLAMGIAGGQGRGSVTMRGRSLREVCNERRCYVGRSTLRSITAGHIADHGGGDGAILTVEPDGRYDLDLSTMTTWLVSPPGDAQMEGRIDFRGHITGRLELPRGRGGAAHLVEWNTDGVTGEGGFYLGGELVFTMTAEDAREIGRAFSDVRGTWVVTPCSPAGFSFSNTGTTFAFGSPAE